LSEQSLSRKQTRISIQCAKKNDAMLVSNGKFRNIDTFFSLPSIIHGINEDVTLQMSEFTHFISTIQRSSMMSGRPSTILPPFLRERALLPTMLSIDCSTFHLF